MSLINLGLNVLMPSVNASLTTDAFTENRELS